jgi:hypothetical protein
MPALSLARAGPPSVSESLSGSTDRNDLGGSGRFRSGQVIDDQPSWSVRTEKTVRNRDDFVWKAVLEGAWFHGAGVLVLRRFDPWPAIRNDSRPAEQKSCRRS